MIGYSKRFDTIVIGVGGIGSATCYELAKRGKNVLGLEQFDIPHDMGSSHGYTRIIRLAYYEHPSYVMLLKRAYELWAEIEKVSGEKVFYQTGSIDAGPADSWVFKGSLQSCIEHNISHEVLTGKALQERYPGYQLPFDTMALYQEQGGFLAPEKATVAYVNEAIRLGAEIHGREKVLGWEPLGNDGVKVYTTRSEYEADSLVVTSGAWNDEMMPFLHGLAVPERQVLAWLQPTKPEYFKPHTFPVFNLLVDEGRFYGFPIHGVPGFKFGMYHHFEEHGHPDELIWDVSPAEEDMMRDFAGRHFPDGAGPTMTLKACMFTNSPDGHFIIDLHPQYPQVSFGAGFSGHGYKFASVLGEVMADLAERQYTRHEISLFNLARLTGQVSDLQAKRMMMPERVHATEHSRANPISKRYQQRHFQELSGSRGNTHSRMHQRNTPMRQTHHQQAPQTRAYSRINQLERQRFADTRSPYYWQADDVESFW